MTKQETKIPTKLSEPQRIKFLETRLANLEQRFEQLLEILATKDVKTPPPQTSERSYIGMLAD